MPNVLFAKHFFWHTTVNTKNFVHFQSQQAQSLLPHFSEKVMYPPETSSKALLSHKIGKLCWTLVNRSAATCNCRQWPPETWLFLKDHCVKCSSQISGWSTNTSMLHYTNTTLPAYESEQCPRRELWKYSMNSGGNWPELSSYKHKYISNHCSMPEKDNRGSDREKDCHLNNGMLNKASTPLNKMLLSSKAQQSIQCW